MSRRSHETQWAAQFAVASELCKRGYEVGFTSGNCTPIADLMVFSPKFQKSFLVDVKGLSRPNAWILSRKPKTTGLFYVLALVPADAENRFFIIPQATANQIAARELKRLGRSDKYPFMGFNWRAAIRYEEKWDCLPR